MKLAESTTMLERSHSFEEANFSIGDPILIMEYLRKNAYSNPKKAICQEIMCNARDAHREIDLKDPIKVKLPTRMDPIWYCQDFGPGINPSRMKDVFIQFGKSSKRSDNVQTGGFGIGAKTPWAYTDTFLITTICNIEGSLIKYQYAAVIGENRIPKLVQMAEPCSATENSTGTTISFTVEANDFHDFNRYSYEVSSFWDIRPEIINNNTDYNWGNSIDYRFKTETWAINEDRYNNTLIIIDGIPYNLNIDSLGDSINSNERYLLRAHGVILFFKVGELSVSLNREALYYDARTIKSIMARIKEMTNYLRKHFEDIVDNCSTLWDAAVSFKKAALFFQSCGGFLKGIKWKGKLIPTEDIRCSNYTVGLVKYSRDNHAYRYAGKVRRFTKDINISFNEDSILVKGDSKSKIEHQFSLNKNLKNVYVFFKGGDCDDTVFSKWLTDTNIMELNPLLIENLPERPKVPRVRSKSDEPRVRVKTYIWEQGDWRDTEMDSSDLEDGEGIYVPCFRRRAMVNDKCEKELKEIHHVEMSDLMRTFVAPKFKVYGIQKDLLPKLGKKWVCFYTFVKEELVRIAEENKVNVGVLIDVMHGHGNTTNNFKDFHTIIEDNYKVMPKLIQTWYDRSCAVNEFYKKKIIQHCCVDGSVHKFLELSKLEKDYEKIETIKDSIFKKYKLLESVGFNRWGYDKEVGKDIVVYLEAMRNKENKVS